MKLFAAFWIQTLLDPVPMTHRRKVFFSAVHGGPWWRHSSGQRYRVCVKHKLAVGTSVGLSIRRPILLVLKVLLVIVPATDSLFLNGQ